MTGRRLIFAAALAGGVVATVVAQAQKPASPQQPVFRAGVNLVMVDAYPRKDGRIVEGLTPGDFEILEDGKPQKVETFEFVRVEPSPTSELKDPNNQREMLQLAADPHNRVFVVFLDPPSVSVAGSYNIRQPLGHLLDRMLAPNDLFGVMTPTTPVASLVLQRKTDSIEQQLAEHWDWGQADDPTTDPSDLELERVKACGLMIGVDLTGVFLEHRTLMALRDLVSHLGGIREARSHLVLVTMGWTLFRPSAAVAQAVGAAATGGGLFSPPRPGVGITGGKLGVGQDQPGSIDRSSCVSVLSGLANVDDDQLFKDIIALANQKNVSFYPINPAGLEAFEMRRGVMTMNGSDIAHRTDELMELADNTDGRALVNTNDLEGGVKKMADDLSAYYLLGYYSTNPKADGHFRQIKVRVTQPKVDVSARHGYLAPTEAALATASAVRAAAPTIAPEIDTAVNTLGRLDSDRDVFVDAHMDGADLVVAVELASRLLTSGDWLDGGAVRVTVGGVAAPVTGAIPKLARGALVRVPIGDAAGPWTVKAAVTGGGRTVEGESPAARPTRHLLGDPTVFRGAGAASAPLRPSADFGFSRTERLHVELPLSSAVDARTARVLDRRGQPMPFEVTVSERDTPSHTLTADLALASFAPGDYLVEIRASANGAAETALVPFRVVR